MEEKQKGSTRNIACKIRLNDEENNILDKICKKTDSTKIGCDAQCFGSIL